MKIMKKEECKCESEKECCGKEMMMHKCHCHHGKGAESSALYGLGVIGSLFYFLNGAVGLGAVLIGIGKAIFWPAFVVFKLLGLMGI